MISASRRRLVLWICGIALLSAGCWGLLLLPLSTRQGVDYRVTEYRIPAYVKAIDFLQRHLQYQILVSRICAGQPSDADCVMAIFDWTHQHIRPTPDGWPIVDDHPLHIVIRGYGDNDQMADIFTVLAGYVGVPAYFVWITNPVRPDDVLALALVRLEGRWAVFDVERHVVFRTRGGQLASVDDLVVDAALVDSQAGGARPGGVPYSAFIAKGTLLPLVVPSPTRSEMQQPWPRLSYELKRAVGWARE